jgi:hydroxymethylpyrimidine/phosphomethylpyrimidine kinase
MLEEKESDVISSKKEYFYSFMRELFNHHRHSREVFFYANTLNISSNYLNEICQSVCDHSAKEVIDYYLSSQLKFELNNSNKSIQKLTEEYNFPNQSYFCRYYKRMIGETPSDTRKHKISDSFAIF